jgi:hypothetical protein
VSATDERARVRAPGGFEPALHLPLASDQEQTVGSVEILEVAWTNVLKIEHAIDQPGGLRGYQQLARSRHRLDACGEVGGFAGDRGFFAPALAHQIADDHLARRDPDPGRQRLTAKITGRGDRIQGFQTRPHRPLGMILVGDRPAKIGQDAIPQILCHVALVASNGTGASVLVAPQQLAHRFGVQAL